MKRYIAFMAAATVMAATAVAQDSSEPKFTVKPTGRILMDGAAYMGGNDDLTPTRHPTRSLSTVWPSPMCAWA